MRNSYKLPFCNPKTVFYPTNMNKLCVMALIMHVEVDVWKFCKQTVVLHQKLSLEKYLYSGVWLVVTNENLKFIVSCQSGDTEINRGTC